MHIFLDNGVMIIQQQEFLKSLEYIQSYSSIHVKKKVLRKTHFYVAHYATIQIIEITNQKYVLTKPNPLSSPGRSILQGQVTSRSLSGYSRSL